MGLPGRSRSEFFDTITVEVGHLQRGILRGRRSEGVNLRPVGQTKIGITLDEAHALARTIEAVWRAFGVVAKDTTSSPTTTTACRTRSPAEAVTSPIRCST